MEESHSDIHDLIRARWSSRAFDPDRPVSAAMIDLLLEAARWAPSAGNGQPWRYIVFDSRAPGEIQLARDCLFPGNRVWAERAPVLLLAVAKMVRSGGKRNFKAEHDLGLANENLLLQAIAMGLHCRPMAGFDVEIAREHFGIPEGHEPMVMIAVGYPGSVADLPQDIQEKESAVRTRRGIGDFAFLGAWNTPYSGGQ